MGGMILLPFVLLMQNVFWKTTLYNLFERAAGCIMVKSTLLKIFEARFDKLIVTMFQYTWSYDGSTTKQE